MPSSKKSVSDELKKLAEDSSSHGSTLKEHGKEIDTLQKTQESFNETQAALSKTLERLSFVVVGDDNVPNYQSLAEKVDVLEKAKQIADIKEIRSHAKLAGIWATVTLVVIPLATLLAKLAWHVDISGLVPTDK